MTEQETGLHEEVHASDNLKMNVNENLHSLYPTLIYHSKVTNYKVNQQIDKIIDKIDFGYNKGWGKTHELTPLYGHVIDEYNLTHFRNELVSHIQQYIQQMGLIPQDCRLGLQIENSWFTRMNNGDYAHIHSHGCTHISGVYYYRATKEDTPLCFESPLSQYEQSWLYQPMGRQINYPPDKGIIILFPGWLKHGTGTQLLDSNRISLSFNINIMPEMHNIPTEVGNGIK